jgi:hypothetical protein
MDTAPTSPPPRPDETRSSRASDGWVGVAWRPHTTTARRVEDEDDSDDVDDVDGVDVDDVDDDDDDDDARCRRAWSLSNHQKPRDDEDG